MSAPPEEKATAAPPPAVLRRFWPHDAATLLVAHRPFLIGRLLEEGDADELRWLLQQVGREALADHVERHGARALSHRSRGFWAALLDVEYERAGATARELWPLA